VGGAWILDLLLLLMLVAYVVSGYRRGLLHSAFSLAGVALGATVAYFAIPLVGSWVPEPMWRVVATVSGTRSARLSAAASAPG
jgi:uncharacterized membrane protein required for colicin V production